MPQAQPLCACASSCVPYSLARRPRRMTASSQARSQSIAAWRAAKRTAGCHQYTAHAISATKSESPSCRRACAASCARTASRRLAVHVAASAGMTIDGRNSPYVKGPVVASDARTGKPPVLPTACAVRTMRRALMWARARRTRQSSVPNTQIAIATAIAFGNRAGCRIRSSATAGATAAAGRLDVDVASSATRCASAAWSVDGVDATAGATWRRAIAGPMRHSGSTRVANGSRRAPPIAVIQMK